MERHITRMSLKKRAAAAIVAAALAAGVAGPILSAPADDSTAVETVAKGKIRSKASTGWGGSWS